MHDDCVAFSSHEGERLTRPSRLFRVNQHVHVPCFCIDEVETRLSTSNHERESFFIKARKDVEGKLVGVAHVWIIYLLSHLPVSDNENLPWFSIEDHLVWSELK